MKLGNLHASGATSVTSGHVRVFDGIEPVEITLEACRAQDWV